MLWLEIVGILIIAAIPLAMIAVGIVFVGYLAYGARMAREEAERELPDWSPDHVADMKRLNDEIRDELRRARHRLDGTRDAFRKGLH